MASATMMGLRRRTPVNSSPTMSSQSPSTTTTTSSSKRSRSENNNSPFHGNLNSMSGGGGSRDEPPTKKSRGTSTNAAKNSSSCSSASSSSIPSSATATCSASSSSTTITSTDNPNSKSRGTSISRSATQTKSSSTSTAATSAMSSSTADISNGSVLPTTSWPTTSDVPSYASVTGLGLTGGQTAGLCAGSLGMPTPIPYMSTSMATFVGNATNLGKSSSVSYLDISNMTGGSSASGTANSLSNGYAGGGAGVDAKGGIAAMSYTGMPSPNVNGSSYGMQKAQGANATAAAADGTASPRKFQNDAMFNAYQPWVIRTYGDLAKTKTITIKKYARILRTLRGEEVNSAENSKFRFWVKSKGFHIGQPEGYDAKPADRIIGRHAVTSPGLDPPLYVPTQLPHNKALNGAEGTVPPGRVYKKVAIVENFFDIIHAVHVDLEGRPGKHAGQKRTYRTITETYAFLPREAVTRFLLGCTECQRRPRTPSPTNLSNQPSSTASSTTLPSTATALNSSPSGNVAALTASSSSSVQSSPKPRDSNHHATPSEGKNLHNYRHQKQHKNSVTTDKSEKDKDEKYNPLSITNLLKKEPVNGGFLAGSEALPESRRTPESDRASSRSSASSKRKRMLPEGRTPSPQPSQPLPRPWSPGLDPKNTPIDYSLPITISYLKHQQRLRQAEKSKAASAPREPETEPKAAAVATPLAEETESAERERFSPATGLIDTNLNLLAIIQYLHWQVMLVLTERLRPSIEVPSPLVLPPAPTNILAGSMMMGTEVSVQTGENHSLVDRREKESGLVQ